MPNLIEILIRATKDGTGFADADNALSAMGGKIAGLGTSLTVATAPLAGFFAMAIKQASDEQTVLAQLNQVIKSTGGVAGVTAQAADDLAKSLQKVTRYGDDTIISAENMLLTFSNISSNIFPDVTKVVLDLSTAMNQDLKSSAIQVGKALNDPVAGMSALARVGVQFTQAQKDMIKSMVEAGNTAGAQSIILKELQREFGGSAEAAGKTFAGSLDILNHKFDDFAKTIGNILMPIIQKVTGAVGDVIDKVIDWANKNPALAQTLTIIGGALVVIGPALIVVGTGMMLASKAFSAIGTAITFLTSPIGLIILAIAALALAFQTNFLGIRDFVTGVITKIQMAFSTLSGFLDEVGKHFRTGGILSAINQFFSGLEDGSTVITNFLTTLGMAPDTAQKVSDAVGKVVTKIDEFFQSIKPGLIDIGNVLGIFSENFQEGLNTLIFYAGYAAGKIISALGLTGLWDAVHPALQPILDWFSGTGTDSLTGALSAIPQFISDNLVAPLVGLWRSVLQPALQPIVDWFRNDFLPAIDIIGGWINSFIITPLVNLWNQIQPLVTEVATVVAIGIQRIFQPFIDIVNGILDDFEKLKRAGGAAPSRALPGESSPGVVKGASTVGGLQVYNQQGINYAPPSSYYLPPTTAMSPAAYDFTGMSPYGTSNLGTGAPFINAGTAFINAAGGGGNSRVGGNARAGGGPVSAGMSYLVGEHGPEMFIPQTSGRIDPSGKGGGFAWNGNLIVQGGGQINVSKQQFWAWLDEWWRETYPG